MFLTRMKKVLLIKHFILSYLKIYVNQKTVVWIFTLNCFTLDKSLTPEKTILGNYYGFLNLGNNPVLHYIWVDVQTVINLIKEAKGT